MRFDDGFAIGGGLFVEGPVVFVVAVGLGWLLELFEDKDTDFESPSVTLVQINSTLSHLMVAGNTLKLAAFPASLTCLMSGRNLDATIWKLLVV